MAEPIQRIERGGDNGVLEVDSDGIWPEKIEDLLILLMEEEVKKGNKKTTTFNANGWRTIRAELNKRTHRNYTHIQLKNKYNGLRARWKTFKQIVNQAGVSYCSVTGEVKASEDLWEKMSQVIKHAKRFQKKGCKNYSRLCTIFGDVTIIRVRDLVHAQSPSTSKGDENDDEGCEKFADECSETHNNKKAKYGSSSGGIQIQSALVDALTMMAEVSKKKLELLEKRMSTALPHASVGDREKNLLELIEKKMSAASSHASVGDREKLIELQSQLEQYRLLSCVACVDALDALDGIDGASYAKAINLLHDDPSRRMMFLGMSDKRKKDWVLNI